MALDREAWSRQLHLSNFINAYYELRDVETIPRCRTILLIGPGQGLEAGVLRWRGYAVETFDIDPTFNPDHLGSVHDMRMFSSQRFDVIIASHVLEHLAEPYLDDALKEIARVGRYAIIYLPVAGRHAQVRVEPGVAGIDWRLRLDFFNYVERVDATTPRFMSGEHFWEVGRRGFRAADVRKRLSRWFTILHEYRNPDWLPSYNFVLQSTESNR